MYTVNVVRSNSVLCVQHNHKTCTCDCRRYIYSNSHLHYTKMVPGLHNLISFTTMVKSVSLLTVRLTHFAAAATMKFINHKNLFWLWFHM